MKPFISIMLFLVSAFAAFAEPVNEMCPVTPNEPVEPWLTTEFEGQTIGFCCKSCLRKFNANPSAYIDNIDNASAKEIPRTDGPQAAHFSEHTHTGEKEHDDLQDTQLMETEGNETKTHDHAKDHGSGDKIPAAWLILLGKLHVIAVHLPIALLPLAGVLEFVGMLRKSSHWFFAARANFLIGALSAVVAAGFGLIAESQSQYSGELESILSIHETLGLSVAAFSALGITLLAFAYRGSDVSLKIYRTLSYLLILLVPLTAHFGGTLVYGVDYLF